MNFIEAINLLNTSAMEAVRRRNWEEKRYIFIDNSNSWRLSATSENPKYKGLVLNYSSSIEDVLATDWEIYKKGAVGVFTFEQALAALKNGEKIKRISWLKKELERDFCDDYSISFTIDDIEANDWIIVEDEANYEK